MENITIREINKKDSGLVIVKYDDKKEATLNTKWQSQEVDYLEKDVGIGGSVIVEIVQKGNYTNITKVDMTSAKRNEIVDMVLGEKEEPKLMSQRDISIVAQVCVKGAIELAKEHKFDDNDKLGEFLCMSVNELVGAYKVAVNKLECVI